MASPPGTGATGPQPAGVGDGGRGALRADCARCAGLCCVAPAFAKSADFAITKPAGRPCPNLGDDFRCAIHAHLRERGFPGCTAFDCFGAGQRVTAQFAGRGWRSSPTTAPAMFAAFDRARHLHELLWYLTEALELEPDPAAQSQLRQALARVDAAVDAPPPARRGNRHSAVSAGSGESAGAEPAELRSEIAALLRATSARVRGDGPDLAGADLIGRDLRRRDLRRASLRGAYLIGADLRGTDLSLTDLTGADLRGTRLAGADLRRALFVTQLQLDAALGDTATRLPAELRRPDHWT